MNMIRKNKYVINIYMAEIVENVLDNFNNWYNDFQDKLNIREMVREKPEILHGLPHRKITIPRDDYLSALVASEVYETPAKRKKKIEIYELDERYNTERTVIYKTDMRYDDIFIIGIRGTSNSFIDLLSDVLILVGKDRLSIRKNIQVNFIKDAIQKLQEEGYNPRQSIITGHSLGGTMCTYMIEEIPIIRGVAFNMGASPLQNQTIAKFTLSKPPLTNFEDRIRFRNYFVKGDLVSVSSKYLYSDTVELVTTPPPSNMLEAHKMSFIINHTTPDKALRGNIDFTFKIEENR